MSANSSHNEDGPFGRAWRTIKHLFADALVAGAFITLLWAGQIGMEYAWPNGSDPAVYGIHIHDIWMVAKFVVFVVWLAVSTLKLIIHLWRE